MRVRSKTPFLTGALTLALAGPALAVPTYYTAALSPENNSGVTGAANLELNGNLLTVSVTASGLVPDQTHMAHLHGLLGAAAPNTAPAPPTADSNGDGFVESTEGAPYSGPPIFGLPTSPSSPATYATASAAGTISYTQTYDVTDTALYNPDGQAPSTLTVADILGTTGGNTTPLTDRILEFHGLNVPAGIDGTTGPTGSLVYDPMMPVAAGLITQTSGPAGANVPEPGSVALLGSGLLGLLTLAWQRGRAVG